MKKPMATRKKTKNHFVEFTLLMVVLGCFMVGGTIEYNDLINQEKVAQR